MRSSIEREISKRNLTKSWDPEGKESYLLTNSSEEVSMTFTLGALSGVCPSFASRLLDKSVDVSRRWRNFYYISNQLVGWGYKLSKSISSQYAQLISGLSVETLKFYDFEVPSEGLSPVIIRGFILICTLLCKLSLNRLIFQDSHAIIIMKTLFLRPKSSTLLSILSI